MLVFENINARISDRVILKNVSFTLPPHKLTVLLGRNGQGKTTLLRCAQRLQRYSGSITLDGTELSRISSRQRAALIAFLPQTLPNTTLSVRELAALGRNPHVRCVGFLSPNDRARIESSLEITGMASRRDQCVQSLSGGEKKRAFWTMILAQDTSILMLDEPLASLDAVSRRDVMSQIKYLITHEAKTVLLTMHDLNEAVRIADNIVILNDGGISFSGCVRDCLDKRAIERTFDVKRYDARSEDDSSVFFQ